MINFEQYQQEVFQKLQPLSETDRVLRAQDDKKSKLKFLAIRVPVLRKLSKEGFSFESLAPEEVLAIWDFIWKSSEHYEVMSMPLMYYSNQGKKVDLSIWETLSTWNHRVENWGHADHLSGIYSHLLEKDKENGKETVYQQLKEWNQSDSEWLRRMSLVSLIHYTGKKAVFLPVEWVFPLVDPCLEDLRYYVQKAIGWVLREMSRVYPEEVRGYLSRNLRYFSGTTLSRVIQYYPKDEQIEFKQKLKGQS